MSNAPRPATWNTRSRNCAGHDSRVGAADVGVALLGRGQLGAALGAVGGHDELALVAGPHVDHRTEHLGDHLSGLADHDGVADQHALALDLGRVVQRRQRHRRAGDQYRLHVRERGDPAGAADIDPDVEQRGGRFLGRVLVRDGPARRAGRGPQAPMQRHLVDLDHQTVDLVLDVVPVLVPVRDALDDVTASRTRACVRRHRQPPRRERVVGVVLRAADRSPRCGRARDRSCRAAGAR